MSGEIRGHLHFAEPNYDPDTVEVGAMWIDNNGLWLIALPDRVGFFSVPGQHDVTGEPPKLTITPSIAAEYRHADGTRRWHGFITDGYITDA